MVDQPSDANERDGTVVEHAPFLSFALRERPSDESSIHVYGVQWREEREQIRTFEHVLSSVERARADRLRFDEDRARYVLGRGLLREVAARTFALSPADVPVTAGPQGKPQIPLAGDDWGVNVSHSGAWVLCAVGPCSMLGVDVEQRSPVDPLALAECVFSDWERDRLARYSPAERERLFFRIWSMKEAVIKADGAGVSFGLDRFDVEFRPGSAPAVRRIEQNTPSAWHVVTQTVDGHEMAVAWCHETPFPVHWHLGVPIGR